MENGPAHWARILGLLARKQGRRGARGGLVDNVVISASANRSGLGGCPDSSSGQASQARHILRYRIAGGGDLGLLGMGSADGGVLLAHTLCEFARGKDVVVLRV